MSAGRLLIVVIASALALFAGVNLFAATVLGGARLDLTERGLYRLSPGAVEVVGRLDEPVTLTFYYSRASAARYPALRAYGARVREMLRGVAARSGGRVRLEEIDPAPFSEAEDAAIAAGLDPLPTEDGGQLFFGLKGANAVDDRRVVAFFDPAEEARLEYEIVRVIAELARSRPPRLAVISSLPFAPDREGRSGNPIIDELAAAYEIDWLDEGFSAIPEADALVLLHPGPLTEAQLYLIDQFALSRRRVLAAIDPLAHVALKPGPDGLPPINASRTSSLPRLLEAWGASSDTTRIAMDREHGLPVQINDGGRTRTRAYPLWFTVPPSGLDAGTPATAALTRGVNLGSPGALVPVRGAGTRFTPLITASPQGALVDADIAGRSPSPDELLRDYRPANQPPVIAARLTGMLRTAFPEGPPAGEIGFEPSEQLTLAHGSDVVVIADADWLDPSFYLRPDPVGGDQVVADNPALALNLIDALAGDPALVSLRSRASSVRPMTRVDALRTRAEARYLELQDQLRARLATAEGELAGLSETGEASPMGGAGADSAARAEALRGEIVSARARLRDVERGLRVEIDALERALILWTVWIPPLTVIAAGLGLAIFRRRRGRT